jgi:hypothetical protein
MLHSTQSGSSHPDDEIVAHQHRMFVRRRAPSGSGVIA